MTFVGGHKGNTTMTTMKNIRRQQLAPLLEKIPPEIREMIAEDALQSQKAVLAYPYYSTVRVRAVRSGTTPTFTYTVDTNTRKAFGYKVGDEISQAGFAAATTATLADTNLTAGGSQTNDNSDVLIWGVCAELCQGSEILLAEPLWRHSVVQLSLGGTNTFTLGPLSLFPNPGGLFGAQRSKVVPGSVAEAFGMAAFEASNGNPTASSYRQLPQPVRWNASGSGKKDAALTISLTPTRPIVVAGADRAAATGIEEFTAIADAFVDVRFSLVCLQVSERSTNV